jgi:hypothetical protein
VSAGIPNPSRPVPVPHHRLAAARTDTLLASLALKDYAEYLRLDGREEGADDIARLATWLRQDHEEIRAALKLADGANDTVTA